jgi:hypothetical protein
VRKLKSIIETVSPPRVISESIRVSFNCPICKNKAEHSFMYIPVKKGRGQKLPKLQTTNFCKFCGKQISICYKSNKNRAGEYIFHDVEFFTDNRKFTGKWLKVLSN